MSKEGWKTQWNLLRLHRPLPILLLFFPCAWGLAIAQGPWIDYVLFFIGSVSLRGFGCIINDWLDRDLDCLIERTKTRPLACGALTIPKVAIATIIDLAPGIIVFCSLTQLAKMISLIGLVLAIIYPTTKRWFVLPQVFLGFTFNIGVFVGIAQAQTLSIDIGMQGILLYIIGIIWTLIYDTVYAFSDYKDDCRLKLHSSTMLIASHPLRWICLGHGIIWILWLVGMMMGMERFSFIGLAMIIMVDVTLVRWWAWSINDAGSCLSTFSRHIWLGPAIWLSLFYSNICF